MSDSNQIIERLHKKSDEKLRADAREMRNYLARLFNERISLNLWHTPRVFGDRLVLSPYQLIETAEKMLFEAGQEACREREVDGFMARVSRLSDEMDEIRAIAEEGTQQ